MSETKLSESSDDLVNALEEFVAEVRGRLRCREWLNRNGLKDPYLDSFLAEMHRLGWSTKDAADFMSLTEEFNPELDEDVALAKMSVIRAKYDGKPRE